MGRSLNAIYDSIIAEKQNQATLSELLPGVDTLDQLKTDIVSSPSNVAIWRLWVYVVAVSLWVHEGLWDAFKAVVEAIAARAVGGSIAWYAEEVKKFQYGDEIIFVNNRPTYAVIDESKKIIKHVAIIESTGGKLIVKVATEDGSGNKIPLDADQLIAFNAYLNDVKYAGTGTQIISLFADLIKTSADVYYNPLIPLETVRAQVIAAIEAYYDELDFNGLVYRAKIEDRIQAVTSVKDVVIQSVKVHAGSSPENEISRNYQTLSGYIEVDPAYPLTTTLNFIASYV